MIVLIDLCVVFILAPTASIQRFLAHQHAWTTASLGRATDLAITQKGAEWFRVLAVRTHWMRDSLMWARDRRSAGAVPITSIARHLKGATHTRVVAIWWALFAACYRAAMVVMWLPYTIPIMAAALWDGWQRRRISKWRFEFTSPMRHRYASRGVGYLVLIAIAVPALPVPIPPLAVPAALGLLAVTARFWVASIQKRI